MLRILTLISLILVGSQVKAVELDVPFASIDGGTLALSQWRGQPVLVVNTASRCGYTYQYSGMQTLYNTFRDRGLVVLAVPSNDFRQELGSNKEVKEFCALQFDLDFPMTEITAVTGDDAHPFFRSLKQEQGFVPKWNFNKVLLGPEGEVVATYRSNTKPTSARIRRDVEGLLN